MDKIKVLQVVQGLDVGGLERVAVDLALFSDKAAGLEFIFCSLGAGGAFGAELQSSGIEVVSLNKSSGFAPDLGLSIASIIKSKRIDILHTHNQRPQFYGATAAKVAHAPVYIHTRHSKNEPDSFKNMVLSMSAGRFADRIVCVSDAVYRYSLEKEKIPPHKLQIIKNGIDISRFQGAVGQGLALRDSLGIGPGTKVVGTVGRLAKVKNQALLIEAFKIFQARVPDSRLLIAGDGPLKEELMNRAAASGLGAKVVFLGERKDVPRVLNAFDVFALSSLSEGLPVVLLEAMASGLPVIATDVGGIPELIRNEENGLLLSGADAAGLGAAMERLFSDGGLRTRISENNRARAASEFDVKRMCGEYAALYCSLLAKTKIR